MSLLFVFLFCNRLLAQQIPIVTNGSPKAKIVLNENASENVKKASLLLQKYVKEISGATLPLVASSKGNVIRIITSSDNYRSDFRGKESDAYILRSNRNGEFLIVGSTDLGTEFGIYDFIERCLEVTWLMPTDLGTYVPTKKNLSLPQINVVSNPSYKSRQLSPIDINGSSDLNIWGRRNRLVSKISFHHNMNYFVGDKNLEKYDADIFPIYGGKRYYPKSSSDHTWQPNFSSPAFKKIGAEKIIEYFSKNENASSFSLGINDTHRVGANQLKSKSGKNYLGFENSSDAYYSWVNGVIAEVNKKYPNKKYGLLAYYNVADPPSTSVGVSDQVVPYLTYERIRWSNLEAKRNDQVRTAKWAKHVPELGWYDYLYGNTYLIPRAYPHIMAEYLKWGNANKVKHFYGEIYPNWGEGPKYWLLTKLLWNPNQNVDNLLNEWYEKCVGKDAATYLRQYYTIWENYWSKKLIKTPWFAINSTFLPFNNVDYLKLVDEKMIRDSETLLENVCAKAKGNKEKQRAQAIYDMWSLYKLGLQLYSSGKFSNLKDFKKSEEFLKVLQQLKENPLHRHTVDNINRVIN